MGSPATVAPPTAPTDGASTAPGVAQHPLLLSVLLHLFPGAALTVFVVMAAPVVTGWGFPPVFALFAGILLVIVPLELGYLAVQARRATGRWSVLGAVTYRAPLPWRTLARRGALLAAWFLGVVVASTVLLDEWLAETFFAWMPDVIVQFSTVEDGAPMSAAAMGVLLAVAFVGNGLVGPVVEELYFRGHLLARLERLGRGAPVLNTVLFSVYHLWTPWQNPARIIGFLPMTVAAWRSRSVWVAMVAHVMINTTFLLLLLGAYLAGGA